LGLPLVYRILQHFHQSCTDRGIGDAVHGKGRIQAMPIPITGDDLRFRVGQRHALTGQRRLGATVLPPRRQQAQAVYSRDANSAKSSKGSRFAGGAVAFDDARRGDISSTCKQLWRGPSAEGTLPVCGRVRRVSRVAGIFISMRRVRVVCGRLRACGLVVAFVGLQPGCAKKISLDSQEGRPPDVVLLRLC
jgi:hypothetical protein